MQFMCQASHQRRSINWAVRVECCLTLELKQGTFLRHGLRPEINISHVRTVVFQILRVIVSCSEKILSNVNVIL